MNVLTLKVYLTYGHCMAAADAFKVLATTRTKQRWVASFQEDCPTSPAALTRRLMKSRDRSENRGISC